MNYKGYTYKELLTDDFFLESVSSPTRESEAFWRELEMSDRKLSDEIALARKIVISVAYRRSSMAPEAEDELFDRINASIGRGSSAARNNRLRHLAISLVAVFVLLLVSGGFLALKYMSQRRQFVVDVISEKSSLPASTEIQLIRPEGEVTLNGESPTIEYSNSGQLSINSETKESIESKKNSAANDEPVEYHQLIVPFAKRSFLTLSDGTRVWVNANTRLKYPTVFAASGKREIYVDGEIYIEVAHDANRQFVVKTNDVDVEVLGTTFNVTAYGGETQTSVVLVGGKVNARTKDNSSAVALAPGQMATLNADGFDTQTVNTDNYVSWHLGAYTFSNVRFSQVLEKLSNYYGTTIVLSADSEDFRCSGTLTLRDSLQKIVEGLAKAYQISSVDYGNQITINVESKK